MNYQLPNKDNPTVHQVVNEYEKLAMKHYSSCKNIHGVMQRDKAKVS
jgi:desulfoferrodoxin (superoxide reductase-like protein)